ncbi:MAG: hypothetical protein ABIP95_12085 [Pelobium sp.]
MNKLITFIMLCFSLSAFAQESFQVNGYFKENYRSIEFSKQAQRLLFVKTNGNVVIPQWAYYLNLIPSDAEKIGLKDILVIASNGEDYEQSDTKLQNIKVLKLSNLENNLFIDLSNPKPRDEKLISVLKNPAKTDTLQYNLLYNTNDFRLTKQWIDVLDNTDSITLESVMEIEYANGTNGSMPTYSLTPINEFAKDALHYVANLFDLGQTEDWTKAQWLNWYDKVLNEKTDAETLKNSSTFTIPNNFSYDQHNMALYGKDELSKKIIALEALRYNVDYFEGHQIIQWDSLGASKSDYYRTDQKQLFIIDGFNSRGDDLYVLGKLNNWAQLKYDKNTKQYNIQKQLMITLPETLKTTGENEISLVQMGDKLSYAILKNKDSKSFFVVTLNTLTGEVLFAKKIKELLPNVDEKNLSFVYLKYGTEIPDGFLLGIRQEKKYHLVKINENLSAAKIIETSEIIQNATVFVDSTKVDVVNFEDGYLRKISFDASLNHRINRSELIDFKDKYYDEDGTITFDGANYQVFFPFSLPLYSVIKMYTLNQQFKRIKQETVYQFLEVENPIDENMVHLLYASKLQNKFWLFLKVGTDLQYVKIAN